MMDRPINAVPFLFLLEKIFHALGAAAAARSSKRRRLPPLAKQSREAVAPMHHPFLPSFMCDHHHLIGGVESRRGEADPAGSERACSSINASKRFVSPFLSRSGLFNPSPPRDQPTPKAMEEASKHQQTLRHGQTGQQCSIATMSHVCVCIHWH